MATVTLRPTADQYRSTNVENSDDGTTNLYSYVDEATLDTGDSTRTTSNFVSGAIEYTFNNPGLVSGNTINKITVYAYISDNVAQFSQNNGATLTSIGTVSTPADMVSVDLTTNPLTSSAWTYDEINALDAGLYHGSNDLKTAATCYQFYIVVDYNEVTPENTSSFLQFFDF